METTTKASLEIDVRDDEEEENKSTSFCATISATGPQYATSISKLAFVVVSIIVN
jgi:hypothetical protein